MDSGLIKVINGFAFRAKKSVRGANLLYQRVSFADLDPAEGTIWKRYFFDANPQTVNTNTGIITLSGVAPTVSVSSNTTASTSTGNIVLIGLAPFVFTPVQVLTTDGSVVLSGVSPSIVISDNTIVFSQSGAIFITGIAPEIPTSSNVVTYTGELVLTARKPIISARAYFPENVVQATIVTESINNVDSTISRETPYFVTTTITQPSEHIVQ